VFRGRALAGIALSRKLVTEKVLDAVGGIIYLDQNRRGRIAHAARKQDLSSALRERAAPQDMIEALIRNRAFVAEYADARTCWQDGAAAVFPPGTYWLQRFAAVRVLET
jgi:hypothetical protein